MIIAKKLAFRRGIKLLLDDANMTIHPGQKVGLVGANGCGKSSLLSLILGQLQTDSGDIKLPVNWQIATVKQETPALDTSALEYVIDGFVELREVEAALKQAEIEEDGHRLGELHGKYDALGGYSIKARASAMLHGLGFTDDKLTNAVSDFSGGWRMRLNLAQALIRPSDLLLLDEPTNHLDLDAVVWLEHWLRRYEGTLVLISHDREFLDATVQHIVHIEHAQLNTYGGNYSTFERTRAAKLANQQAMYEKQQREIAHMHSYVERFRYKASKAKQAQSRIKALERMDKISAAHVDSQFNFSFRSPEQLPEPLLTMREVSVGYDEQAILKAIKLNLVPGSRIGLLGRNGAGKSTLIKLLASELAPMSGEFLLNPGAKVGYFAQHQLEYLEPEQSPLQHLALIAPKALEQELRSHLGCFGFQGDKALDPVAPFSGGEKARLVLALVVWQRPNLLLLDEPTNHLDLEMRHALTVALQSFEGAMVIISHDRHLLRMTTDELYLVHDQQVEVFPEDLAHYEKWLLESSKAESAKAAAEKDITKASEPTINRKEQKRLEAEFRKTLSPIKKKQQKLDIQMEKLSLRLTEIEALLQDETLYQQAQREALTQLLKEQGEQKSLLEDVELDWFETQEQVEQMTADFEVSL